MIQALLHVIGRPPMLIDLLPAKSGSGLCGCSSVHRSEVFCPIFVRGHHQTGGSGGSGGHRPEIRLLFLRSGITAGSPRAGGRLMEQPFDFLYSLLHQSFNFIAYVGSASNFARN